MLTDAEHFTPSATPVDICIIGGGVAGITVAHALSRSGLRILLLEAGGRSFAPESQDAYRGELSLPGQLALPPDQREAFQDYLHTSRLRFFGGTSNHWAGFCRPLDAEDFGQEGGWPLTLDTLRPHYTAAAKLAGVADFIEQPADGRGTARFADASVRTLFFHHSAPVRFGERYGPALAQAAQVQVVLGATVTALQADPSGRVEAAQVATRAGRRFEVRAGRFVLACGGIENARLLLLSDARHPGGLGNGSGHVGRHFMDHLMVLPAAQLLVPQTAAAMAPYSGIVRPHDPPRDAWERRQGHRRSAVLALAPALRRRLGLNNLAWYVFPLAQMQHQPDTLMQSLGGVLTRVDGRAWQGFDLVASAEARPHPGSRVTLANERDALGCRRVRLDWRLHDADITSIARATEQLALALGRSGRGRVRVERLQGSDYPFIVPQSHHAGTTRMSAAAADGVVNADCRLHEAINVHVCGSSVFPAIGFANPTLTIIALALRLAGHLQRTARPEIAA
jgi:choline dehydrogenase-like flavoprotein